MGQHRAEPGRSPRRSQTAEAPGTTDAPYVGRRIARPSADPAPLAPGSEWHPHVIVTGSHLVADIEPTLELPIPPASPAGRRKATRHAGARGPLLRGLPSPPLLLGVATLAVAVAGSLVSGGPALADHHTASVRQASALTGTSGVARVGARGPVISRSSDRQTLAQASGVDVAAATKALAQHDSALSDLAAKAQHQAAFLNNNQWALPVDAGVYHLTARFGDTGLWASFHTGLDFAASTGTPIHAVASGTVTDVGYEGAYGNKTVITTADGTEIWFGHQTTQYVQVGQTVTRGEVIGTVGSTGNVTGPHVHIEVRPGGGDPVDPFPAFVVHGVTP